MRGRVWIGVVFLVIGIGFLLQQMGVFQFSNVLSAWWPAIFIVIGIIQFINKTYASTITGSIFILIGGLLLANKWFDINLAAFIFPLILIFIGVVFIFGRKSNQRPTHRENDINTFSFFSGADIRSQSEEFKGGSVGTLFGGAEIDLREANISEGGAHLELTAIFGGIELKVPENVRVEVKGVPIFGGWENRTRPAVEGEGSLPTIHIHCLTVFGGVEIRD